MGCYGTGTGSVPIAGIGVKILVDFCGGAIIVVGVGLKVGKGSGMGNGGKENGVGISENGGGYDGLSINSLWPV
jgi:hypothetical protein